MTPPDPQAPLRQTPMWERRSGVWLAVGGHAWGRVDVVPAAGSVWTHTRLTIYPPGTNVNERRLLQVQRDWPVAAAIIALITFLVVAPFVGAWPGILAVVGIYALGVAFTSWLTRDLRRRCVCASYVSTMQVGVLTSAGDRQLVEKARHALLTLEVQLDRGLISPVTFESEWARVYRTVGDLAHEG